MTTQSIQNHLSSVEFNLSKDRDDKPQRMLILCGLVGSGKSTFANALVSFDSSCIRISQDVLGSRQECERLTKRSLREGLSVIIDRQNFDIQQRSKWIQIGEEYRDETKRLISIDLIEFITPISECSNRLNFRSDHETLKNVTEAQGILRLGTKNWVSPHPSEGYERHLQLNPSDQKEYQINSFGNGITQHLITFPIEKSLINSILSLLESLQIIQNTLPRPFVPKTDYKSSRGGWKGRGKGTSRRYGN